MNKDVRRVAAIAATATIALSLAACSASGSGSGSGASGKANIAIVTRDFTNPYWAALRDGAIAEGKAEGVQVTVKAGSSETDSQGENAQISTLANQNYNCYGLVPVNGTNVITPVVPIARKHIPIMNLDTQIDPDASSKAGVSYKSFIGSDNTQAGELAAKALLSKLHDSGKVAVLQGIAGEQNGINRLKGFTAMTKGKLTIVASQPANYDENTALNTTAAILQAHPDITGIFAANDTMGLGAARAVKNAGLQGEVAIVSVDGIKDMLDSVKSGVNTGTITQYPYAEGEMAVQACIAALAKKSVPARVVAPIAYIDSSNVDKALSNFPKPFGPFVDPFGAPKAK